MWAGPLGSMAQRPQRVGPTGTWSGCWAPAQVDGGETAMGAGGHHDERQLPRRGPGLRADAAQQQDRRGMERGGGSGSQRAAIGGVRRTRP